MTAAPGAYNQDVLPGLQTLGLGSKIGPLVANLHLFFEVERLIGG